MARMSMRNLAREIEAFAAAAPQIAPQRAEERK